MKAGERTPADLGALGERFALEFLKRREGYHIVATNVVLPIGRNLRGALVLGELDIVAYDGDVLVFVEVKTRTSEDIARAEAGVDRRQRRALSRAARAYRHWLRLGSAAYRFDLVTVIFGDGASPEIILTRGAFEDRPVRPRFSASWYQE
ncbi:MAG: YraN family protein [Blastocatellia bacterium]|nr:YraN family protein [Blastocatellia bacterium]MCS7157841.1 YraN family protein [Blastocatellia bacterium]MCX7753422.1 YraN family protein [Blastocatellia bacterium]MDW8168081.1 YraN family protein [Acidobacteriota bacterium]MDW8257670.1 YraN family protein [Acidobacteriota bacterium]